MATLGSTRLYSASALSFLAGRRPMNGRALAQIQVALQQATITHPAQ
jgi:hypothetical protein